VGICGSDPAGSVTRKPLPDLFPLGAAPSRGDARQRTIVVRFLKDVERVTASGHGSSRMRETSCLPLDGRPRDGHL
jgi:hypothetical protein